MNNPFLQVTDRGIKAFDFTPWGGVEGFLEASRSGGVSYNQAVQLVPYVPWLARARNMTSVAISNLPFSLVDKNGDDFDTSDDWQNKLGGIPNPKRLLKRLAAALCGGSAYVAPTLGNKGIINLQFFSPHTVRAYISRDGIMYFYRASDWGKFGTYLPEPGTDMSTLPEDAQRIDKDSMIYFYLPDPDVELGPPRTYPLLSAYQSAAVILAMDMTLKTYGDHGFVPATILAMKGLPSPEIRKETERWWNRFLRRWTTTDAKIVNSETMDVKQIGAGMEELKTVYSEIYRQATENIGAAFGIPGALFMSDKAYASEVDLLNRNWYEASEFTSIASTIEEALTDQLFSNWDYRFRFDFESIPAFQTDDKTKMERWEILVKNGVKNSLAADIVGMNLPEGVESKELDPEKPVTPPPAQFGQNQVPETKPAVPPVPEAKPVPPIPETRTLSAPMIKDIDLWRQMAERFYKKNKPLPVDFECKALPEDVAESIREKLKTVKEFDDIGKAFEIGAKSDILVLAEAINAAAERTV